MCQAAADECTARRPGEGTSVAATTRLRQGPIPTAGARVFCRPEPSSRSIAQSVVDLDASPTSSRRITRAGTPTATERAGMLLVTTLPAPMTA